MKNHITKLSLLALAVALIGTPSVIRAQDAAPAAPSTDSAAPAADAPAKHKKGGTPFKGTVEAVDTTANTITVDKVTYNVTEKTKITKNGETATLADLTVGTKVRGTAKKSKGSETLTASTIQVGGGKKKAE
jgi:hypothetical protein